MPGINMEEHGGNVYRVAEHMNRSVRDLLDFSASINPLGIPGPLKEILLSRMEDMAHYPDPEYRRLRSRLSDYTGVGADRIIPGNGSSELIFLLLEVLAPENVLIAAPSFSEYEKAAGRAGSRAHFLELREEEGYRLVIRRLAEKIEEGAECVLLCNPNNPTSTLISREDVEYLAALARRRGATLIVDEAFMELTAGGDRNSAAGMVNKYENLFVIRAFTKIFAVPGLRLGYGMGDGDLVDRLRLRQQPWPVNTLAAAAGDFLPAAGEYLSRTSAWLIEEKEWLYNTVSGIKGIKAFEPQSNFMLLKLPDGGPDSAALKEGMAERGVLIRDAANFRFLNNRFVRTAIRERESNVRMVQALREVLGEN